MAFSYAIGLVVALSKISKVAECHGCGNQRISQRKGNKAGVGVGVNIEAGFMVKSTILV